MLALALGLAACAQSNRGPAAPTTAAPRSMHATVLNSDAPSARIPEEPRPVAGPEPDMVHPDPLHVTELYPYALDEVSRTVRPRGRLRCPDVETTLYRGKLVRYDRLMRFFVGFLPKLQRFEEIVEQTAIDFYGRAPRRINVAGGYHCRRIRACPDRISEHGLGNAIDVSGFEFDSVSSSDAPDVSRSLRRSFKVKLDRHWDETEGVRGTHGAFLRELARRLTDEPGLFRVLLGPVDSVHENHFHFDAAPRRIVQIFEHQRDVGVEDIGCRTK